MVALASTLAMAQGIQLECELVDECELAEVAVRGGEAPLREALTNLMDNALKYCERCEPSVALHASRMLCVSCDADDTLRGVRIQASGGDAASKCVRHAECQCVRHAAAIPARAGLGPSALLAPRAAGVERGGAAR